MPLVRDEGVDDWGLANAKEVEEEEILNVQAEEDGTEVSYGDVPVESEEGDGSDENEDE
ncbi:hypothetical protein FACS1894200_13610 [Spirochaetia bacterium]|nr:hypothetical protein FACS1894200_13610 [Spirochaetia bacterium]